MTQVKKYPVTTYDEKDGLRWFRDHDGKHNTLRFSGNPLWIIQRTYERRGGDDFLRVFYKKNLTSDDKQNIKILKETIDLVTEFLDMLRSIGDEKKSPFVLYIDEQRTK